MAKTKPAKSQSERNKRQSGRCWAGFEPTPGKKPGTKGSCKPKAKSKSSSSSHKTSSSHTSKSHKGTSSRSSKSKSH